MLHKRLVESALFGMVRDRALPHPTSRDFSEELWKKAYDALSDPKSPRDESLAASAGFFGRQIGSLRSQFEDKMFEGLNSIHAITLAVAAANHNFVTLRERAIEGVRKRARGAP